MQAARAIRSLQEEEAFNTSNFLDNLARSIRYEGQVINNLLYPIYGAKPGRLVRTLTGEGESEMVMIGEAADPQTAALRQRAKTVAKLTKDAHFNVVVKVAKSFNTRREQEATVIGELIAADPALMTWFGDLYLKSLDGPGHDQMAERAKLMLAPPIQQHQAQQEQGQTPIPPQVQAELAQKTQQIQDAEAALMELSQQVAAAQAGEQTKLQIAQLNAQRDAALEQLRAQTELEKARMDNATKIHVAEIAARTKGVVMAHEAEHEAVALAHEAAQADLDRMHETAMATTGLAHDAAMSEGSADLATAEAEAARAFEAEQSARAQGDGAGV